MNFDGVQTCAGVTLAPGATCAFTYTFIPQTVGATLGDDELLHQRAELRDDLAVGHGDV